ncbi:hypothetical protein RFI_09212 [Reticulomyxa filosa]|uniref:Uncharacterized protein n=1 Tax=Reticulomyxa filosa TaxID=46433 RepID=X6NNT7_RETFI|nr:hypothetical protein RFI_09212 [Reticulomyxa filosa]|eukprot:ETO27920.1 hypothetical protein RFI_09212 [Reticulomyxa filosa]
MGANLCKKQNMSDEVDGTSGDNETTEPQDETLTPTTKELEKKRKQEEEGLRREAAVQRMQQKAERLKKLKNEFAAPSYSIIEDENDGDTNEKKAEEETTLDEEEEEETEKKKEEKKKKKKKKRKTKEQKQYEDMESEEVLFRVQHRPASSEIYVIGDWDNFKYPGIRLDLVREEKQLSDDHTMPTFEATLSLPKIPTFRNNPSGKHKYRPFFYRYIANQSQSITDRRNPVVYDNWVAYNRFDWPTPLSDTDHEKEERKQEQPSDSNDNNRNVPYFKNLLPFTLHKQHEKTTLSLRTKQERSDIELWNNDECRIFRVTNILSTDECTFYMKQAEDMKFQSIDNEYHPEVSLYCVNYKCILNFKF